MTTDADKSLDKAESYIKAAFKELTGIITGETWGTKDYNYQTILNIKNVYIKLIDIKDNLNRDQDYFKPCSNCEK